MDVSQVDHEGSRARRIGVLGGSFDPIHNGHLVIAQEVRFRLSLERVLFVPAQVSPLKMDTEPAEPEHRARMVELAIASNPAFALSRVDLDRPGPSYTVDTLRLLKKRWGPGVDLFFIIGEDSLETLLNWRAPQEILNLSQLVVVRRPGFDPDLATLEEELPQLRSSLTMLSDTPELSVSSTELRRRVHQGWPIRYQVPRAVREYIEQHGLYLDSREENGPRLHGHNGAHLCAGQGCPDGLVPMQGCHGSTNPLLADEVHSAEDKSGCV